MTSAMLIDTVAPGAGAPSLVDLRRPAIRVWTAGRPGFGPSVRRPRLVRPLCDPDGPPLVLIVAPAGYGKTTLLHEWAERDRRPFAWITLDERDNDARRILAAVARAVDDAVGDDGDTPFVLVLDDVQALYRQAALDALATIANDLPRPATLVLAGRRQPALPLARMRVQQLVTEVGARDLAMTRSELAAFMRAAGHAPDRESVDTLLQRTEGWPVGISLAALFLAEQGGARALARFRGDDRLVGDYVRDELLSDVPVELLDFMLRTSVADTLTGAFCDGLLERSGSAAELGWLRRAGLVVAVDRTDEYFRYHRLVAEALRARLHRMEPEAEAVLHRRASAWQRNNGDIDRALHHALSADDARAAGELVWSGLAEAAAHGRATPVERRLDLFAPHETAADAKLALAAAGCDLVRGQAHLAEYWASAAAAASDGSVTGKAVAAGVALMRAGIAGEGVAQMRDDAARASMLLPSVGSSRSLCCLLGGVARHLLGERDEAARQLEEGARRAAVVAPNVHALCLAELAALEAECDDWEAAAPLIARARAQVDRYRLADYPTTALVFAVSALVQAHRGRIESAQCDLTEATRLEAELVDFAPWYRAEVRILLARTALRLGDVNVARNHLAAAARLVGRVPEATMLLAWLGEASAQLDSLTASGGAPPASMTAAELRILRFLPTHLSFREIAERTYVSANTVKTQANAVYRKLDVSCRSDAVARARGCGLLDA